ncbi:hypothetical protein [Peribacillus glennii]|uniref:Uncharacterized protein n=1 Tax=Peribacillus glennii TaxID=2303991 RepID=A0A372L887_9BACI|nr:hypothetical protein [Peribacillus glennii]RFU61552.1 hypothetical protein D0466_17265 [Peribacillus glennii]
MDQLFDIAVSKDRLSVKLSSKADAQTDLSLNEDSILDVLRARKIVLGYKHGIIQQICKDPFSDVSSTDSGGFSRKIREACLFAE